MGKEPGENYWDVFAELDIDGSAELDYDEFAEVMDNLPGSTRILGDGFHRLGKKRRPKAPAPAPAPKPKRRASLKEPPTAPSEGAGSATRLLSSLVRR